MLVSFRWATRAGRQRWICQAPFVSFLSLNRPPSAPWQTPEKPFTVQAIWTSQRRANFMGTESEAGSTLWEKKKKKRAGEAVSVFKSGWGSVQWLPSSDTLTTQSHTHTHIQTLPCTDAYKLWTPDKLPPDAHTRTHALVFDCGSVAWGFKILDYGNAPELCNLLSSHS